MRRSLLLVALLALAGCFDASVGEDAVIACLDDAACPSGRQCIAQQCIDPTTRDITAPALGGAVTLSSSLVRGGDSLQVDVVFDEPLGALPVVRGEGAVEQHVFSVEPHEGGFRARFSPDAQSVDGVYELFAVAVDGSGNEGRLFLRARYVVDNTAPVVERVAVSPARVRSGRDVDVRVLLREADVGEPLPQVSLVRADDGLVVDADVVEADGAALVARFVVPPGAAGAYGVVVGGLVDAAGNAAAGGLSFDDVLLVDDDVPTLLSEIEGAPLVAGRYRLGRGQRAVARAVAGGLDEEGRAEITVDDAKCDVCVLAQDGQQECTCTLDGDALAPGPHVVAFLAIDGAGNALSDVLTLDVDVEPPQVAGASADASAVPPGARVDVRVDFVDNDLAVTEAPGVAGATLVSLVNQGSALALELRMPDVEGIARVQLVGLRDRVGNTAAAQDVVQIVVDGTPPRVAVTPAGGVPVGGLSTYGPDGGDLLVLASSSSVVDVLVDGAPSSATCSPDGDDVGCVLGIDEAVPEGLHTLLAVARDAAANEARALLPFVVDRAGPRVVSASGSPAVLAPGGAFDVRVELDEPLAAAPVLRIAGVEVAAVVEGRTVRATTTAPSVAGDVALEISGLQDAVGNQTAAFVAPAVAVVDAAPPLLEADIPTAPRSLVAGFDQLAFDVRSDGDVTFKVGARTGLCAPPGTPGTPGTQRCTYVLGPDDAEGVQPVTVEAVDAVGNRTSRSAAVLFDFTAPRVVPGASSVVLRAAPGALVSSIERLGLGAVATVSFIVDEPLGEAPVVRPPPGITMIRNTATATTALLELRADATASDGPLTLDVDVVDRAGNRARLDGLPVVDVDVTPPVTPSPAALARLTYRRVPWGAASTAGRRAFTLAAAAGTLEPRAVVTVWDGPDRASASEVGRGIVDDAGALSTIALSPTDRAVVYVSVVDGAGNVDGEVANAVRTVEWVATLGGKVEGSVIENPHIARAQTRRALSPKAGALDVDATELGASLALPDGILERTASAPLQWRELPRSFPLTGQGLYALATDPVHARVVSYDFGGQLLALDATGVHELPQSGAAPTRGYVGFSVDAWRERAVVFGGFDGAGACRGELDEWDGSRWRSAPPAAPWPDGRYDHGQTFDSGRGRTIVFGGDCSVDNTLWEWDGVRWTARSPDGPSPGVRLGPTLVYDPDRRVTWLMGGFAPNDDPLRIWTWDGERWTDEAFVGGRPGFRYNPAGAFDVARSRLVIFGGAKSTSLLGGGATDELWQLDGDSWVQVPKTQPWPSPRYGARAAYDPSTEQVLLAGGYDASFNPIDDVWAWDGSRWRRLLPQDPAPSGGGASLAHHVATGTTVRVPTASSTDGLQTWALRDSGWAVATTSSPPARRSAPFVHDPIRDTLVLFGGSTGNEILSDTWTWDGAAWLRAASNEPQNVLAGAFHADIGAVVALVRTGTFSFSAVRRFDGSAWSDLPTTGLTREVTGATMALDEQRGVVVAFVNQARVNSRFRAVRETWELDGTTWSLRSGFVAGFDGEALVYHRGRQQLLGTTGDGLFRWTGSTWEPLTTLEPRPPSRAAPSVTYDDRLGGLVVHGGANPISFEPFDDTWVLQPAPAERPAHVVRFDVGAARLPLRAAQTIALDAIIGGGGGGDGGDAGDEAGAVLSVWSGDRFVPLVDNDSPADAPVAVHVERNAEPRELLPGVLVVAIEPRGDNGAGAAVVNTDHVELRVRFVLDDADLASIAP